MHCLHKFLVYINCSSQRSWLAVGKVLYACEIPFLLMMMRWRAFEVVFRWTGCARYFYYSRGWTRDFPALHRLSHHEQGTPDVECHMSSSTSTCRDSVTDTRLKLAAATGRLSAFGQAVYVRTLEYSILYTLAYL